MLKKNKLFGEGGPGMGGGAQWKRGGNTRHFIVEFRV